FDVGSTAEAIGELLPESPRLPHMTGDDHHLRAGEAFLPEILCHLPPVHQLALAAEHAVPEATHPHGLRPLVAVTEEHDLRDALEIGPEESLMYLTGPP